MKKIAIPVLLAATVGFIGCEDDHDHDHAEATITFDEPANNEVIPLASANDVHIHIEFVWDGEGHGIEVKLHPTSDANDLIIDYDQHSHDATVTFMQDVDLSSYPAGAEFHLEAKACEDHDCEESVTEEIHFSLGQ